jgi:hypothetical protein
MWYLSIAAKIGSFGATDVAVIAPAVGSDATPTTALVTNALLVDTTDAESGTERYIRYQP